MVVRNNIIKEGIYEMKFEKALKEEFDDEGLLLAKIEAIDELDLASSIDITQVLNM